MGKPVAEGEQFRAETIVLSRSSRRPKGRSGALRRGQGLRSSVGTGMADPRWCAESVNFGHPAELFLILDCRIFRMLLWRGGDGVSRCAAD